jgi:RHS repeat-associated protein
MGELTGRRTSRGHVEEWERPRGVGAARVVLRGEDEIAVSYDPSGREVARRLPGGARIETSYDPLGRLAARRVVGAGGPRARAGEPAWVGSDDGRAVVDRSYRYSASSLLVETRDEARGARRCEYDALDRLSAVLAESGSAELFRYDAAGNLFEAHGRDERVYGAGDRLLRKGDTEYHWDAAGRLVEAVTHAASGEGRTTRYRWSGAGLLAAVERPDGAVIELEHDAFARRIGKRVSVRDGGSTRILSETRFVWDSTTLVHEIKRTAAASGDVVVEERTYCFEDRRTVPWAHRDVRIEGGERSASGWFHYLNDDTGAPERLVDGRGEVACELAWTAWGKAEPLPGATTTTPIRFRGQYADEETGLSYNRYRYYDPEAGRYISADPIGLLGGLNAFAYADDCPTSAIDAEGLMYSVIKDSSGRVLFDGENSTGAVDRAVPSTKPCAEAAALSQMARDIRRTNPGIDDAGVKAEIKNRFAREGLTMETYEGTRRDYERTENKPNKRTVANPCSKCAAMFQELGIADHVMAHNNKGKNTLTRWNGHSTYRP